MTIQPKPSSVASLQQLLSRREHQAFLDELQIALEDADPSQLDYLRALGGDGLHLLLRIESAPRPLLETYASLLLAGDIHAPSNTILALNRLAPSAELGALAMSLMHAEVNPDTDCDRTDAGRPGNHPPIQLKRVIQILDMGVGSYSASDAIGIRRSVFRSEHQRTFIQALALRFPALYALPNYPLDQLADFDKLRSLLDAETLQYGLRCRVNAVLVVPGEGDPVAAFELESLPQEEPGQARRDRLRSRLFRVIQIPFFRLRTDQCASVGVDEWYALLTDEVADKIDCGRRLRVRASHSMLIPA